MAGESPKLPILTVNSLGELGATDNKHSNSTNSPLLIWRMTALEIGCKLETGNSKSTFSGLGTSGFDGLATFLFDDSQMKQRNNQNCEMS